MRKGLLLFALLSALVGCENLGDTLTDDLTTTLTFYDENEAELIACPYRIGTVLPADSLPTKSLKRGYLVDGWRFFQKGTNAAYDVPKNVTKDDYGVVTSVTVTSVPLSFQVVWWKPITYTIIFDGNGGKTSDGENKGKESYEQWFVYDEYKDKDERLDANKFERGGYIFKGWNTAEHKTEIKADYEDMYKLRDNFAEEDGAVVTLYACWLPDKITVTFDANGGTETMAAQELSFAALPQQLNKNTFTRTGWNFGGWKTAAGVGFADGQSITSSSDWETLCAGGADGSVTLTAVWNPRCVVTEKSEELAGSPGTDSFVFTAPEGAEYHWLRRADDGTLTSISDVQTCTIAYADYDNDPAEYTLIVLVIDKDGIVQNYTAKFHVNPQQ
ncbi:MAG: InlB B-repeat-containing protein [Treponemataceae bacterium]|nr:InlB B-repeat-containing protein [Treponemataceae bacterium]